jgi:hypothetical protein
VDPLVVPADPLVVPGDPLVVPGDPLVVPELAPRPRPPFERCAAAAAVPGALTATASEHASGSVQITRGRRKRLFEVEIPIDCTNDLSC